MKFAIALLLSSLSAFAAAPVISSVTVPAGYLSHGSALVLGESNIPVTKMYVKFGTSTGSYTRRTADKNVYDKTLGTTSIHIGKAVHALDPSTQYFGVLCGMDETAAEGCSSEFNFTTPARPADRFARTLPTVEAIPAQAGSYTATYTVTSSNGCNDALVGSSGGFQAALNAAAALSPGAAHVLINMPSTCLTSGGAYVLPGRAGGITGYIDIKCSDATTYPSAGQRLDGRIQSSGCTIYATTAAGAISTTTNSHHYRLIGMNATNAIPAAPFTITNVNAGVYTTSGPHLRASNDIAQVWNGSANYITNCKMTVLSATTFSCQSNSATAGTIGAGANIAFDATNTDQLFYTDLTHGAHHIGIERCNFYGNIMPGGVYMGLRFHLQNSWIVDSTVSDIVTWAGSPPEDPTTIVHGSYGEPISIDITWGNGITIRNNMISGPGTAAIFAEAGTPARVKNVVIERNYFTHGTRRIYSQAGSDKLYHAFRPWAIEFKQGSFVLIKGNTFERNFNHGSTGLFGQAIVLTPRAADSHVASSDNGITDFTIVYNLIRNGVGFLNIAGFDADAWAPDVEPTKRILVANNRGYDISGWEDVSGQINSFNYRSAGQFLYVSSAQDMLVENNEWWNPHGGFPVFLASYYDRHNGLVVRRNILGASGSPLVYWYDGGNSLPAFDNTGTAEARFNKMASKGASLTTDTGSSFAGNLIVSGVTSSATPDYTSTGITAASCASEFPSNVCATGTTANDRFAYPSFENLTNRNFRLKYNSPVLRSGYGVDNAGLTIATGKTEFVRYNRGVSPYLSYQAPDTAACDIEVSSSSTPSSGTRTSDGGGARYRQTPVTLGGNTYVRLACGAEVYSCSTTGGDCSLLNAH